MTLKQTTEILYAGILEALAQGAGTVREIELRMGIKPASDTSTTMRVLERQGFVRIAGQGSPPQRGGRAPKIWVLCEGSSQSALKNRRHSWWERELRSAIERGEGFNAFCLRTRKSGSNVAKWEGLTGVKLKRPHAQQSGRWRQEKSQSVRASAAKRKPERTP